MDTATGYFQKQTISLITELAREGKLQITIEDDNNWHVTFIGENRRISYSDIFLPDALLRIYSDCFGVGR